VRFQAIYFCCVEELGCARECRTLGCYPVSVGIVMPKNVKAAVTLDAYSYEFLLGRPHR